MIRPNLPHLMRTSAMFRSPRILLRAGLLGLGVALLALTAYAAAPAPQTTPTPATVIMHPLFPLLDDQGVNVLDSGRAVSTMTTCGACHDAAFIANHSFHADLGLSSFGAPGSQPTGQSWDSSPGAFGAWDPLFYRYLSPQSDPIIDLTTAAWVQSYTRHVGGGPAAISRDGAPLTDLLPDPADVEAGVRDPLSGRLTGWDWQASGVVEMNCFLCHTANPDNAARLSALQAGEFGWANTATLAQTGVITPTAEGWQWQAAAFDAAGNVLPTVLTPQDPTNANCGQCHGVVHTDTATPLALRPYSQGDFTALTTGQIMAPDAIADSGLNLKGKTDLTRPWDVHTERVLACTDCHFALNNPVYYEESAEKRPTHLTFDPRRLDLSEYLYRPLHQFAKGQSAHSTLASEYDNTLRRCESCHSLEDTHTWLPYKEQHAAVVACESCHIPQLYAPALEYVDWTVLQADGQPVSAYRGSDTTTLDAETYLEGYTPILLLQADSDGRQRLAPFNLVSAWYWVYGDPARPAPLAALQAAYLDGNGYRADILAAFDADHDGALGPTELTLDTPAKTNLVRANLADNGLSNPAIAGQVQPYAIHHDVATEEWATRDCRACHGQDSRVAQSITLADRTPGGVTPGLPTGGPVQWAGSLHSDDSGQLYYAPQPSAGGLYLFGHNAVPLIDRFGAFLFISVLIGVAAHGSLRYLAARRQAAHHPPSVQPVYMYDVYERLWHWLQTLAIVLLLLTGLIIHKPDQFGIFSFSYVVQVHNILAAILVINAALSLFYHLVSGEIQQFLPRPRGFFDQAIIQTGYYLRGIFKGEPHPFDKTRQHKLNPLQQMTYFAILNVLLPLQIITGALMWGVQRWPDLATRLGGLPFLAPFHTLIAWSFGAFIVLHVYLTTTGHTPLAGIRAMMLGWDEVEVHPTPQTGD